MTQKELLYFEDAESHEDAMICYLNNYLDCLNDELKDFFNNEIKVHENIKKRLLNELEDNSK